MNILGKIKIICLPSLFLLLSSACNGNSPENANRQPENHQPNNTICPPNESISIDKVQAVIDTMMDQLPTGLYNGHLSDKTDCQIKVNSTSTASDQYHIVIELDNTPIRQPIVFEFSIDSTTNSFYACKGKTRFNATIVKDVDGNPVATNIISVLSEGNTPKSVWISSKSNERIGQPTASLCFID